MNKVILSNLYTKKKLSMEDIAQRLNTSHATVYYWLKKHKIKRRSWSESAYLKQNPNGDPFSIKKRLNTKEKDLLTMGLMLYWAEGNKKNKQLVQLGNLDCRMLQVFLAFLRIICKVDENKIVLYVRVYEKFNHALARQHWSNSLGITENRIRIYPHYDKRSKISKQWSQFGIATLQVNNVKLKRWLDKEIQYHLDRFITQAYKPQ